jgi:DNA repair protein RadC
VTRDKRPEKTIGIKEWPSADRPRERLLREGPAALSDAELLAILLRTGTGGKTAVDIAHAILTSAKGLRGIANRTPGELMRVAGVKEAKAVALLAAFELGRRVQGAHEGEQVVIAAPGDVARFMIPRLRDVRHEVFIVLLLDTRNGLIGSREISRGTLNASIVHPREVFKQAIDALAASVIVVHNHPSGNAEPSAEDIAITRQLVDAGKLVGIPVHDHIIVAGDAFTSLAERGIL